MVIKNLLVLLVMRLWKMGKILEKYTQMVSKRYCKGCEFTKSEILHTWLLRALGKAIYRNTVQDFVYSKETENCVSNSKSV